MPPAPYGRRTGSVRVLCMATPAALLQTAGMARDARATTFVTGAAGFIGAELVKVLVARGHHVVGLTPTPDAARRVRQAGGIPVTGDLLRPGKWQDEAAADWVFHLPPRLFCESRLSRKRAVTRPLRVWRCPRPARASKRWSCRISAPPIGWRAG